MNRKGFTIIELLTVMAVLAILIGLLVPVLEIVKKTAEDIKAQNDVQVVVVENGLAEVEQGKSYKIEFKPKMYGPDVKIYLTDLPVDGIMLYENGKTHLMWTPTERTTFKTKVTSLYDTKCLS